MNYTGDEFVKGYFKGTSTNILFMLDTEMQGNSILDSFLQRVWYPQLSVTGMGGLPEYSTAGNVVIPEVTLRLSLRLSPTYDATKAFDTLKKSCNIL